MIEAMKEKKSFIIMIEAMKEKKGGAEKSKKILLYRGWFEYFIYVIFF